MSRGLRYASLEELPPSLRHRLDGDVELESWKEAHKGARARKPRRDEEHEQQVVFFNRIRALAANDLPRYGMPAKRTVAIPNGGGRSRAEAGRLKAEGVTRGVSDILVAWPHDDCHGMFIEMKAARGRVSEEQAQWLTDSGMLGYLTAVCYSADEAFKVWKAYVEV